MWPESERCAGFRLSRFVRPAAALALAVAAACGSPDVSVPAASPPPSTSAIVAERDPTASASAPSTSAQSTEVPAESVPSESVPDVSVATTSVPTAPVSEVPVPEASVPTTSVPATSVPEVSVPSESVPSESVPSESVPEVSVPAVSVPSVLLPVVPERDAGYDRDDWGPHNSDLCRGAVGSPDPYTGTPIDTCNVDHVVALHEAHESGGWAWSGNAKQRFSQDPANHVASRACVNQSKGGDDISEWSDADIARSSACGGGYSVTAAGRCFLARTTIEVKSSWDLAVDQAEANALSQTLAGCGDQAPGFSAAPRETTATTSPPTTVARADECVIAGKTADQYDAVSGIGEVLSARLVAAQPFSSRSDLETVRGIGPVKADAVWSHFCGQ